MELGEGWWYPFDFGEGIGEEDGVGEMGWDININNEKKLLVFRSRCEKS